MILFLRARLKKRKQAFDDDDDDDAKKKKKTFHRSRFVNTYVGYSYVYSSLYLRRYYYDYSTKHALLFFSSSRGRRRSIPPVFAHVVEVVVEVRDVSVEPMSSLSLVRVGDADARGNIRARF